MPNTRKKMHVLNSSNVKKYLLIHECVRELLEAHGSGECRDLVEDMVSCVFDGRIFGVYEKLDSTRAMLKNCTERPEREQIRLLKREEKELNEMIGELQGPCLEVERLIKALECEASEVQAENQRRLGAVAEQARLSQAGIEVRRTGENKVVLRKQARGHLAGLEELRWLIAHLENKQVAESISKAIFEQEKNLVVALFDPVLTSENVELTLDEFQDLQRLREVPVEVVESHGRRLVRPSCQ